MNFLKNLLIYWLESVKIFLPQNLKLAFLLTLKNLKDTLPKFIINVINMKILNLTISYIIYTLLYNKYKDNSGFMLLYFIGFILLYSIFLSLIKPTIEPKNNNFIIKNTVAILVINGFTLINNRLLNFLKINDLLTYNIYKIINYIFMLDNISYNNYLILTSPLLLFFLFFILDTKNNFKEYFKAFIKAFLMFSYNYPFCFIIFNFLRLLILLILKITMNLLHYNMILESLINSIIFIILFFAYNIFLMNFYINQIHTKFDLYYKKIDI